MKKKKPAETKIDATIGARLRAARLAAGLSQQTLAAKIGVAYQQLQKYETGKNRITASRLYTVAKVLNTTPGRLVSNGADEAAEPLLTRSEASLLAAWRQLHPSVQETLRTMMRNMVAPK